MKVSILYSTTVFLSKSQFIPGSTPTDLRLELGCAMTVEPALAKGLYLGCAGTGIGGLESPVKILY